MGGQNETVWGKKKLLNENGECTPLFNIHCYSLGINSFSVLHSSTFRQWGPSSVFNVQRYDLNQSLIKTLIVSAQARALSQQPKPAPNGRTPPNQNPNNASPNTRLTRMVQQVKDVLPQVPATAISRDLSEYKKNIYIYLKYFRCPRFSKAMVKRAKKTCNLFCNIAAERVD